MGDMADWQIDQMLAPGDGCDGVDEYYEEDGMSAPWDAVADYGLNEAGVIGFVKTPCRTCRTFHAEGECPGPEPELEWAETGGEERRMKERYCTVYEGCRGTGVLGDLCDSGSGRLVYCDCAAGHALRARDESQLYGSAEPTIYGSAERLLQESRHTICEVETVADRAERLASRYTRYDGSPR